MAAAAGFADSKGLLVEQAHNPVGCEARINDWRRDAIRYVQAMLRREGGEAQIAMASTLEAWKRPRKWTVSPQESGAAFHFAWAIAKELGRKVLCFTRTDCGYNNAATVFDPSATTSDAFWASIPHTDKKAFLYSAGLLMALSMQLVQHAVGQSSVLTLQPRALLP